MQKTWVVEVTPQFGDWWSSLAEDDQQRVRVGIQLLAARGPALGHPYTSGIIGSRHGRMRELRVQSGGRPLRILYALDPRRVAILLAAGDKTGDDRFYERMVPLADRLYDQHLDQLKQEGSI